MRQVIFLIYFVANSFCYAQSILSENTIISKIENETKFTIPNKNNSRCNAILKFPKNIKLDFRLNFSSPWESLKIDEHVENETHDYALLFFNESDLILSLRQSENSIQTIDDTYVEINFKVASISENRNSESLSNRNCKCAPLTFKNRVQWNCPTGEPAAFIPTLSPLTHIVIHHQAGFANPPYENTVNAIFDYHVNTLGWSDIGYNWLIAPNGEIFKGRAWIDETNQNVLGAHTCSCNANKLGVCLLGNFTTEQPSSTQYNALQNFMVWKACELDIELPVASNINSRKSGSCIEEIIPKITGHKDNCGTGYTACPGDKFYPQLEKLRAETIEKYYACLDTLNTATTNLTETNFKIYPNPNSGDFILLNNDLQIYSIEVLDIFSKIIYKAQGENPRHRVVLDLSKGLYLIKTIDKKGKEAIQKMMVE